MLVLDDKVKVPGIGAHPPNRGQLIHGQTSRVQQTDADVVLVAAEGTQQEGAIQRDRIARYARNRPHST